MIQKGRLWLLSLDSVFGTIIGYVYDSNGEHVMSRYNDMKIDREYARELSGRAIDTELIMEASNAYSKLQFDSAEKYTDSEEYGNHARKYSEIYSIVLCVTANRHLMLLKQMVVLEFRSLLMMMEERLVI